MQSALVSMGGTGQPLLFAHGNGYPPESYRQLLEMLALRCQVSALEHRPLWGGREPPRRLRWRVFVDDLLSAVERDFEEPVWLLGHSMGGTIATLAAARAPERFAGLLLLDPVFLPDRYVLGTRLMSERRKRSLPMIRRALNRPESFENFDAAFEFYRAKRAFQRLSDEALWDYVRASKAPGPGGEVTLRYPRDWEAAVYGSAPRFRHALRKIGLPTLGIRGRDSDTLRPGIFERWRHWQPSALLRECPGGHLFPLEHPQEAAAMISHFLDTH